MTPNGSSDFEFFASPTNPKSSERVCRVFEPIIYTEIERPSPVLVAGLQSCGVATVVEAMGPFVGPQQTMADSMLRRTTKACVAGPAVTAACTLADNLMMHAALRLAKEGDVIVVEAGHSLGAQWGELVTRAAMSRGLMAAVIDGPVRDVDAIEDLGFPVWSTIVSPLGASKHGLGGVNCPASCGGVAVEPGDIIVADGDGVVVVPRNSVEEIVRAAEARKIREDETRSKADAKILPGDLSGFYSFLDASGIRTVDSVWEGR